MEGHSPCLMDAEMETQAGQQLQLGQEDCKSLGAFSSLTCSRGQFSLPSHAQEAEWALTRSPARARNSLESSLSRSLGRYGFPRGPSAAGASLGGPCSWGLYCALFFVPVAMATWLDAWHCGPSPHPHSLTAASSACLSGSGQAGEAARLSCPHDGGSGRALASLLRGKELGGRLLPSLLSASWSLPCWPACLISWSCL